MKYRVNLLSFIVSFLVIGGIGVSASQGSELLKNLRIKGAVVCKKDELVEDCQTRAMISAKRRAAVVGGKTRFDEGGEKQAEAEVSVLEVTAPNCITNNETGNRECEVAILAEVNQLDSAISPAEQLQRAQQRLLQLKEQNEIAKVRAAIDADSAEALKEAERERAEQLQNAQKMPTSLAQIEDQKTELARLLAKSKEAANGTQSLLKQEVTIPPYPAGISESDKANWRLAFLGNGLAQFNIGYIYGKGIGVTQDFSQTINWYRKSAEQGNASAQNNLAVLYSEGKGIAKNDTEAFRWFNKAAEQGNALAQNNLGLAYSSGKGVEKDDIKAAAWFRKAAEQGNGNAQTNLGVRYHEGLGVYKDDAQAVYWYRMAAEQGEVVAQTNLGVAYRDGSGVEQDSAKAIFWLNKAANLGNSEAQSVLGGLYLNGNGVAKDYKQAIYWFLKSAEKNNIVAEINLGVMYANGMGVEADDRQAVFWFKKAAEAGNSMAQFNLAVMYVNGIGVTKDESQAVSWYRKAAVQGNVNARNSLQKLGLSW